MIIRNALLWEHTYNIYIGQNPNIDVVYLKKYMFLVNLNLFIYRAVMNY